MQPLVSIIIPTYNRDSFVINTLESVKQQTYQNWECVIIDDHSTDNTFRLIQEFILGDNRFKFFRRPDSMAKGANSCRNFGFVKSSGVYINWFDSDDIMLPEFIKAKYNAFKENSLASICAMYNSSPNLKLISEEELSHTDNVFKNYVLWRLRIITHSIMFKRTILENEKLFDPIIKVGQEKDFFARILRKIPQEAFVFVNLPLFHYIQHENSKSHSNKTYRTDYVHSRFVLIDRIFRANDDKDILNKTFKDNLHNLYLSAKHKDWNLFQKISIAQLNHLVYHKPNYKKFMHLQIYIARKIPFGYYFSYFIWRKLRLVD